jgi:hypothetical protein
MKTFTLTILMIFSVTLIFAQSTEKKSKKQLKAEQKALKIQLIKELVDSKTFAFKATSVIPKNEKTRTLTSDFGIEVKNDSVFSYMPYFGNTYSRDYSSFKDSPMGFMQPFESYKKTKTKSGYDVDISVKNEHDVIDLAFHISKTGSASVTASSINRQAISYMGEVLAPAAKKE